MIKQTDAEVLPGLYRHFKGGLYEVQAVGKLVDSERQFVVYRERNNEHCVYLRDKAEFLDHVIVNGSSIPRFRLMGGSSGNQNVAMKASFVRVRHLKRHSRPSRSSFATSDAVK